MIAGIVVGICGVVGWHGFIYHFVSQLAVSGQPGMLDGAQAE